MTIDNFEATVREFGAGIGMPDMRPDGDGYVVLEFDQVTVHVQYEGDEGQVVAFSRLGVAEVDRLVEIQSMLLAANMFWQGSRGSTFSMEPDSGMVFLADRRPATALDAPRLNDWLNGFVNTAEYWAGQLGLANKGEAISLEPAPAERPSLDQAGFLRG